MLVFFKHDIGSAWVCFSLYILEVGILVIWIPLFSVLFWDVSSALFRCKAHEDILNRVVLPSCNTYKSQQLAQQDIPRGTREGLWPLV